MKRKWSGRTAVALGSSKMKVPFLRQWRDRLICSVASSKSMSPHFNPSNSDILIPHQVKVWNMGCQGVTSQVSRSRWTSAPVTPAPSSRALVPIAYLLEEE